MADCANEAAFKTLQANLLIHSPAWGYWLGEFHWIEILSKKYRTPIPLNIILSSLFNIFMESFTNFTNASSYWNAAEFSSGFPIQVFGICRSTCHEDFGPGLWCFFQFPLLKRCPTSIFLKRVNGSINFEPFTYWLVVAFVMAYI